MKQYISNLLQFAADTLSSDPAIQQARREGIEKIKSAKANAKELSKRCAEQRKEIKNLHKQERQALSVKQKSEFNLLVEEQKFAQAAAAAVIASKKDEMLVTLRQVRKEQQDKIARADNYVEAEVIAPAAA
jgi:glutamate-1-semialdehyde aminotransferase